MLSKTSCKDRSIIQLKSLTLLASIFTILLMETRRGLKNESIECRPWFFNISDEILSEIVDFFTAVFFRFKFLIFLKP